MITSLNPNQVFVFGSNATGFHGAGAAGLAFRGTAENTWRTDKKFRAAMLHDSEEFRIGKWAVFGVSRGLQKGTEGMSYAICTILKPGVKRSMPIYGITLQFVRLIDCARQNPSLEFLMTEVGSSHAGYTREEMLGAWEAATIRFARLPANLKIPENFYGSKECPPPCEHKGCLNDFMS